LRTALHWTSTLQRWRDDPQVHVNVATSSILHLLIRYADQLAKIRPAVESRLAKIPRFLAQGAACLREPVPLWTKLAAQSCSGAETFLREVGEQLALISPDPAERGGWCSRPRKLFGNMPRLPARRSRARRTATPSAARISNFFSVRRQACPTHCRKCARWAKISSRG
jgi:hypothetical protein